MKRFLKPIAVFLMTWSMTIASGINSVNFLTVIFLMCSMGLINLLDKVLTEKEKKPGRSLWLFSVMMSFLFAGGAAKNWTEAFDNKLFKVVIVAIAVVGLICIIFCSINILYAFIDNLSTFLRDRYEKENEAEVKCSFLLKHTIIFAMAVCFIAWLPYFLYLFPGVMTPDSINQLEQAMGMTNYSNHHPWIHTLLIKYTFLTGRFISGTNNGGVACYTIVQMLLCSFTAGFAVDTIKKIKMPKVVLIIVLVFFAIVPFNAVYVVTMWKDVIFGYSVLALNCILVRLLLLKDKKMTVPLGLVGVIICLFRSNGWYGFILATIVLSILLIKKKNIIPIIPILAGTIVISGIVRGPIMKACNVVQPDFVESISVPLQQVARVIVEGKDLSEEEMDLIAGVMDVTYVEQLYDETFADNIKELVRAGNPEYLTEHKGEYLKLYIKLGIRYPQVYLAAYNGQVGGYWYPDSQQNIADTEGICPNDCGVYSAPVIGGKILLKAKEIWIKLGNMIPIYGLIWCTGSVVWLVVISAFYLWERKRRDRLVIYLPSFCILLTVLIATPVSGDFRYIYYLVLSLPVFFASLLKTND